MYITTICRLYTLGLLKLYKLQCSNVYIGYIASYGAWALLCLRYATTLLQKFQYMNVLSYTYISLIINSNNKIMLNAPLKCIKLLIVNIAF